MSRPLLIPQKRPLLSQTGKELKPGQKPVPKILNPSARPAETRMQKPFAHFPEDADADANAEAEADPFNEEIVYSSKPEPIEWALGVVPQPFLDPPLWEAMLRHAREKQRLNESQAGASGTIERNQVNGGSSAESADQRRRRVEREAEYGSMAIRGRSSLRRAPGSRTRRSGA